MPDPRPDLETPCGGARRGDGWRLAAITLLAGGALIGASWLLGHEWPPAVNVLIALSPLPFYVWLVVVAARASFRLDELQQRIQGEALGLTVATSILLLALWGQLQKIGLLPIRDMSFAWPVIVAAYAACFTLVRRRYR